MGIEVFLDALPNLQSVIADIPNRDWLIDSLLDTQPSPYDAAAYIVMILLEDILRPVPLPTRLLVWRQITQKMGEPGGGLWYFVHVWQALKGRELQQMPQDLQMLTVTLGVALAVLGSLEAKGKVSRLTADTLMNDLVSMLQGKSPAARAKARASMALTREIAC